MRSRTACSIIQKGCYVSYHCEELNLFTSADHSLSSALVPRKGLPRQNDENVGSVMRGGGAAHARDKRVGESRHAAQQRAAVQRCHAHDYCCVATHERRKLGTCTIKFDYIVDAVLQCTGCMRLRASEKAPKRRHRTCGVSVVVATNAPKAARSARVLLEPVERMKMRKLK